MDEISFFLMLIVVKCVYLSRKVLRPVYASKIGLILDLLDGATTPDDMDFPGSDFHRLKGDLRDFYSVHVNGNWTIIFQFENGDAHDVDLIDYH